MAKIEKTKKEVFIEVVEFLTANNAPQYQIDKVQHEIDLLNKKSSKGVSEKVQAERDDLMDRIENALAEIARPVTITELMHESEDMSTLSNQRISYLLKQCMDVRKTVVRTVDKKKIYWSLV